MNNFLKTGIISLGTFPPVKIEYPIDWEQDPFKNRSWRWRLHCLEIVNRLLNFYKKSNNHDALEKAALIIESWIVTYQNTQPENTSEFVWHDHSTAKRGLVLCDFLDLMKQEGIKNENLSEKIIISLYEHALFLSMEYFYSKNSNHGIDQSYTLFILAKHLEHKEFEELAQTRLISEFNFAFTKEGVSKENSPFYHNYLLRRFIFINKSHPEIFNKIFNKFNYIINKAIYFNALILRPDGNFPILGDSIMVKADDFTKFKYIKEDIKKLYINVLTGDNIVSAHTPLQNIFCDSGYAIFRNDWKNSKNNNELIHVIFKGGSLSNYHYHKDEGNIILYAFGDDWLIDSGCLNYMENSPERIYMRSREAHNVPEVIGASYKNSYRSIFSSWNMENNSYSQFNPKVSAINNCYENIALKRTLSIDFEKIEFSIKDFFENLQKLNNTIIFNFHVPIDKKIIFHKEYISIVGKTKILNMEIYSDKNFFFYLNTGRDKDNIYSITSKQYFNYVDSQCIYFRFEQTSQLDVEFKFKFNDIQ